MLLQNPVDEQGTTSLWKGATNHERLRTIAQGGACCEWAEIHCSRWRPSSTLGWYSRVMEVGSWWLIHGLVTQFCVSFIAPWLRKRSFQTTQSFHFSNRSLFRSSPVVMNFRWRLKEYCQKNRRRRWNVCEEFSVWHFVTKSTGLKSVKPSMSTSHFPESRDPSYVNSAMWPECPEKDWGSKSFRLQSGTHGKTAQSSSKDQMAWLHLRPCLVPPWCGASRTIWDFCWSRGILGPHRATAPATLPKRKPGVKMNEYAGLHRNFLFMKLSLVCLPKVNVVFN